MKEKTPSLLPMHRDAPVLLAVEPTFRPGPATSPSSDDARIRTISGSKSPQNSVTIFDDGGQAGVIVSPGSSTGNGDVYVGMTAYDNLQLGNPPAGATGSNILYSPTTHAPNGNCLELGVDYWKSSVLADTARYLRIYNFCDNGGNFESAYNRVIDSSFISSYVRVFTNGNGYPEFTSEQLIEGDGKWHALIYNYSTSAWEDLGYSFAGTTNINGSEGWSIFETHYNLGACWVVPPMSADGLRVLVNGAWELVGTSMGGSNADYANCFANPTPTYYAPTTTANYYQWVVASVTPTPGPTPTPRSGPTPNPCLKNPRLCN